MSPEQFDVLMVFVKAIAYMLALLLGIQVGKMIWP